MKKFLLSIFAVMLAVFSVQAQDVVLDFTTNDWGFPESKVVDGKTYTYTNADGYTVTVVAPTNFAYYPNGNYFLFGKTGAVLTLPVFDFAVSKIEIVGRSGASSSVKEGLYADDTKLTQFIGATGTNTFEIPEANQAVGVVYSIKVESNSNAQITKINIYKATDSGESGGGTTEEPETPVDGPSWDLVEKLSDLNAGDEIVIAYNNFGLGAKSNTSTVYHTKVDIKTTNDGKALTDIGEAKVLTVGKNGDFYTFSYGGNYLYWSSGNSLSTNVSVSDNSSWTIAIDNGEATISNKKDNTRKLQYNASSPRFACYTGTQQNVRIYKKVETSLASYTLSVTDAGYATLFLDFNAAIPTNVEAYIIKKDGINNGYITLTQVTGVIPANTGIIVKANAGNYTFAYSADEAADVAGNLLEGSVTDKDVEGEAYVLGIVDGEVGLYKALASGTSWKNNANKAYLPASEVPASVQGAASFSFRFGEGTTAIENVEVENEVKAIFDLTGRRVEEITAPGIYIVNGVKRVVR